jgi:1-deoxy-D-xylulose-5-phosphate synthase
MLATIHSPKDLRLLPFTALPTVCQELREFIIEQVAIHGGHLGASLGVVELTVALHYVFDTPKDLLVWDVGHQAYGHKILTERREVFHTNRKLNGISGFPKRAESQYDTFNVGHSSTAISAALGMAVAAQLNQHFDKQHIAVVGDGALTAGLAFEGLNNAGSMTPPPNLLIIINDNQMSIDENVGALNQQAQRQGYKAYEKLFESLNIPIVATIDGHDIDALLDTLTQQKKATGVRAIYCKTIKGKGYKQAENDQVTWHAPGLFDKVTGKIHQKIVSTPQAPKYQDVFGLTLIKLAAQNPQIVGVTPAMLSGSSMRLFKEKFPTRTFDVGIAEQHAVTFSAGLATQGFLPYCNIYSTFLQRAYDQVIHDVCIQRLKVVFCLDRAGLVGQDGATHHGSYDIAYLRCVPNLVVAAPMNEVDLANLLYTAQLPDNHLSMSIRYPRGQGVLADWERPFEAIRIGKGVCVSEGEKIAILSIGHIGNFVQKALQELATQNIFPSHYDMRFVKPLDTALLQSIFDKYPTLMTIEDGCLMGGFGSAVLEYAQEVGYKGKIQRMGLPDTVIEHGEPAELYDLCGIGVKGIVKKIYTVLQYECHF